MKKSQVRFRVSVELTPCQPMQEIDSLAVWKLESLTRSFKVQAHIIQELERQTIGSARSLSLETKTGACGRMAIHLFGVFAAYQRILSRKLNMARLDAARAQGLSDSKRHAPKHICGLKAAVILSAPMIIKTEVAVPLDASLIILNIALASDGYVKSPYATAGAEKTTKQKIARRLEINDQ